MSNRITPAFHNEMIRALFDCGKDRTSRFQKLGKVGDWFTVTHPDTHEQKSWELVKIEKHPLGEIAMHMHKQEGFISEDEFWRYWKKLHPGRNTPDLKVFVHILAPAGTGTTSKQSKLVA